MVAQAVPGSPPIAVLFPFRTADHDRGTGGLWQVLTPPSRTGGDAEDLGSRLLEQVISASSGPN